ncbi:MULTISPECIES: dihydrofolate reductase family protein [unclassified Chamaesiphon]|uniref:dihydrofolate reductase family protein n=1 Tax=unclassified Chamaesiphon TaxID=2620921 RepID=UPI00286D51C8|nr:MULTISPECIES: dihydrofolate reductase family protein [unclassified Chamaesiphon]
MRHLKYYVACTVDRFIAHLDGTHDGFLTEGEHFTDLIAAFPETFPAQFRDVLGISGENKCFDTVLMGRRTYEVGLNVGIANPYPQMQQYVFSRTLRANLDRNVELISTEPVAVVRDLKQQQGKDIWLCGGGDIATTLFSEIDELILKVNPLLLGSGIPLFAGIFKQTVLELTKSKFYNNGFMLLYYQVKH